jgi:hypothetical protein
MTRPFFFCPFSSKTATQPTPLMRELNNSLKQKLASLRSANSA